MKMKIFLTKRSNIRNRVLIDPKATSERILDWEDQVQVQRDGNVKTIKVKQISMLENIIILDGIEHVIMDFLSEEEFR